MAIKALIFGTDSLYPILKPFYDKQIAKGNLKITGYAIIGDGGIAEYQNSEGKKIAPEDLDFNIVIVSTQNLFYLRRKFLENCGIPRKNIIDGRVFQIPNLDFDYFLKNQVAKSLLKGTIFSALSFTIYPQKFVSDSEDIVVTFGTKSYIDENAFIAGRGTIEIGNFSSLARDITFNLIPKWDHDYNRVSTYSLTHNDWAVPKEFLVSADTPFPKITIGSDVWIGMGCKLKRSNTEKPLVIGDGAVIAADSVVVKDVPPYAIVGGNPAKVIKYRFSEKIIESLLRIKWWNWDIDKIHDNFQYFNEPEKFISFHDKGV